MKTASALKNDPDPASLLTDVFPTAGQIPREYQLDTRSYERLYLIDGELREWSGQLAEISSPICLRDGSAIRRPMIGRQLIQDIVSGRHSNFLHTDYIL